MRGFGVLGFWGFGGGCNLRNNEVNLNHIVCLDSTNTIVGFRRRKIKVSNQ